MDSSSRSAFSLAPLLMHMPDVPVSVRDALRAAYGAEPDGRTAHLVAAARIIHTELAIECRDARELVGLPAGSC